MPSRGQKVILRGKSRDVCAFVLELKGDKEQESSQPIRKQGSILLVGVLEEYSSSVQLGDYYGREPMSR